MSATIRDRTTAVLWAALRAEVELSPDAEALWALIFGGVTGARRGTVSRAVAQTGRHYTTVLSRMDRAGLPSLKVCTDWTVLAFAAAYFDSHDDRVTSVAFTMGHSEPSSFVRFLRRMVGVAGEEFRDTTPFPVARERWLDAVVRPYARQWSEFALASAPRYPHPPKSLVAA